MFAVAFMVLMGAMALGGMFYGGVALFVAPSLDTVKQRIGVSAVGLLMLVGFGVILYANVLGIKSVWEYL